MDDIVVRDVVVAGGSIAYHRYGNGDAVLVGPVGAFYSAAGVLENPVASPFVRPHGTFARCVLFDRRGLGFSDPLPPGWVPTLERQADDLLAVLDHAGVDRAVLLAIGFDAQAVLWFAAKYPDRTSGVIAMGTTPKLVRSEDHPSGVDGRFIDQWLASMDPALTGADIDFVSLVAPSAYRGHAFAQWLHDVGRHSASPETARRYLQVAAEADVRREVAEITAPVMVMHHLHDEFIDVEDARLLARLAPNSTLCVYPLDGHALYLGDVERKLADIERFVTGRAGRLRRRRNPSGLGALTPAQSRVARLVAVGRTNAEIAAELGVSTETVKSHVSAALRKLSARSRVELAATIAAEPTRRSG
jgi:pimeloyl-ACP methyl ester carboxylesterase